MRIPASRDESRHAQQRSRARHKDYVASLERRITEYEQQGVQATLEMQRAARAVAAKNEKLLALLALHGVEQREIDSFLAVPEIDQSMPRQGCSPSTLADRAAPQADSMVSEPVPTSNSRTGAPVLQLETQVNNRNRDSRCGPSDSNILRPEQSICNPLSSSDQLSIGISTGSPTEVTSCEMAASIIVNLRGSGDLAEARQVLGCADNTPCSVKNTHLFQLMNEMP